MALNIEIKARARDFQRQKALAQDLAGKLEAELHQRDVFFESPTGRLKLRYLGRDKGNLISYQRQNQAGPKSSHYQIFKTDQPRRLEQTLRHGLPVRGVVEKVRYLYLVGQTRIHLDDVHGLGHFLELEVVMKPEQSVEDGEKIAREIMKTLEIDTEDLVDCAYLDLMERNKIVK